MPVSGEKLQCLFSGRDYQKQAIRCRSVRNGEYTGYRRLRKCGSDKTVSVLFAYTSQHRHNPRYAGKSCQTARTPVERIKETISGKSVVHFGETGIRAAGLLHWFHCACSGLWRFYIVQANRGEDGMKAMGVLPEFKGMAVHNFWSSYKSSKVCSMPYVANTLSANWYSLRKPETRSGPGSSGNYCRGCVT